MTFSPIFQLLKLMREQQPRTHYHSLNVAKLVLRVSLYAGIGGPDLEELVIAALLHDLGKLRIPPQILGKPGRLSIEEWQLVQKHPQYGVDMIASLQVPAALREYILYHHERWDGTGYLGIRDDNIPWGARLVTVCDSWDAMTSPRPYQIQKTTGEARRELQAVSGRQVDPEAAELFVSMMNATMSLATGERLEKERERVKRLGRAYRKVIHPVAYVQSLCIDDLVVAATRSIMLIDKTIKIDR